MTQDGPIGLADAPARPMSMIEAINDALDIMLERDPEVILMGEDVGYFGGVFRCTDGLQEKYGQPGCSIRRSAKAASSA